MLDETEHCWSQHNYTSTTYYDQDLKSLEIFLQLPSKMVYLRETLPNPKSVEKDSPLLLLLLLL